jgi:hypothetical protein
MAYDAADGYVLLFGGLDGRGFGATAMNDTWAYSNGSWTQLHPKASPPPESAAAMTYDPADGYVVLFGGWTSAGAGHPVKGTWTYRAGNWTNLTSARSPPGRASPALTYDAADGYVVMFGGTDGTRYYNDTWEFAGGNWSELTPRHAPSPRDQAFVTYDAATGYVLLFGGEPGFGAFGDTWEFLHGSWVQLAPSVTPGARCNGALIFDNETGYALLFGGYDSGSYYDDSWAWVAGNWTPLSSVNAPDARSSFSMAYDPEDGSAVLFGGNPSNPGAQENDTWAWMSPWVTVSMTPALVDLGSSVSLIAGAESAAGGYRYNWTNSSSDLACGLPQNGSLSCLPEASGNFSVTLNVTDAAHAWTRAKIPVLVSADPTVREPHPSVSSVDLGQSVTFTTLAQFGSPPYVSYAWTGLAPGCSGIATAAVTCLFGAAETLSISVNVTDSAGITSLPSGTLDFTVLSDPSIFSVTASRPSADVGQSVTFYGAAELGSGGYQYNWTGLTAGCSTSGNESNCTFGAPTNLSVGMTAVDSNGISSPPSAPLNFTVYADPRVDLTASQTVADVQGTFNLTANASLGSGGFRYSWTGLPAQCPAAANLVSCLAESPGILLVQVVVTDSDGDDANSSTVAIYVHPELAVTAPTVSGTRVASENLTFRVNATGGSPPIEYGWTFGDGSSGVGFSVVHAYRVQGTYTVRVTVHDSAGSTITDAMTVEVGASPPPAKTGTTLGLSEPVFYGLIAILVAAGIVGAVLAVRARRRPPRPATGPRASSSQSRRPSAAPPRPNGSRPRPPSGARPPRPRPPSGAPQSASPSPPSTGSNPP